MQETRAVEMRISISRGSVRHWLQFGVREYAETISTPYPLAQTTGGVSKKGCSVAVDWRGFQGRDLNVANNDRFLIRSSV